MNTPNKQIRQRRRKTRKRKMHSIKINKSVSVCCWYVYIDVNTMKDFYIICCEKYNKQLEKDLVLLSLCKQIYMHIAIKLGIKMFSDLFNPIIHKTINEYIENND